MKPSWFPPTALTVAVLVALMMVTKSQVLDGTVQPGANGPAVVEAVLARIAASGIFPDDNSFMRRLAYVESTDGTDPNTFRPGYSGGIWQVDKAMFDATQSPASNVVMLPYIKKIQTAFGIDWPSVKWSDLTKPLYSALAARLYIQYQSRAEPQGIPQDIATQAEFWNKYYWPIRVANDFIGPVNSLEKAQCVGASWTKRDSCSASSY